MPIRSLEELRRRSCDLRGVGDIRLVSIENGAARGQRLLLCRNAVGVELEVAVDRGFDPSALRFRGVNLGWHAPTGLPADAYPGELDRGLGFLRRFDGLLATCGLDHYGAPATGSGRHFLYPARETVSYPLHGRVSACPATLVGYGLREQSAPVIWCEAEVMQAAVFGEVLSLRRRIEISLFEARIEISDVVTNRGFRPSRHAMLYHFNFGYPFLDAGSELTGELGVLKEVLRHEPPLPADDAGEQFDALDPMPDESGRVQIGLTNRDLFDGIGVSVEFIKAQLPQLGLWRCWQSGIFVLGIEPCTGLSVNSLDYNGEGTPNFLEAGASRCYDLVITCSARRA